MQTMQHGLLRMSKSQVLSADYMKHTTRESNNKIPQGEEQTFIA